MVRGGHMKRAIVAMVIIAVIIVMALRGCPRVRRSAGNVYSYPLTTRTGNFDSLCITPNVTLPRIAAPKALLP